MQLAGKTCLTRLSTEISRRKRLELTEDDLIAINGQVARHKYLRGHGGSAEALFSIERWLLAQCGLKLDHAVGPPDPHAPPGGSAVAMRKVA